jgi:GAF domain-containing protein
MTPPQEQKRPRQLRRWFRRLQQLIAGAGQGLAVRSQRGEEQQLPPFDEQEEPRRRPEAQQQFLSQASTMLASSLDYETTLKSVARLAVPFLADWCSVALADAEGRPRRVALTCANPELEALLVEVTRHALPTAIPTGMSLVIRTGEPELISHIPADLIARHAGSAEYQAVLEQIKPCSNLTLPLIAHGQILGAISLSMAASGRHYSSDDLPLAQELALRAAMAVDNARLYREAQAALRQRDEALEARLALERAAMEAQKLDSLGVLAGGIAHDFNNILTAIMGNLALAQLDLAPTHAVQEHLKAANDAAQQAANLTRQMVAYASRGRLLARPVVPEAVLSAALAQAKAQLPANVRLTARLAPGLAPVQGDPDQLRDLVTSLLINAIEAVGDATGEVTISAELLHVAARGSSSHSSAPSLPAEVWGSRRPTGSCASTTGGSRCAAPPAPVPPLR